MPVLHLIAGPPDKRADMMEDPRIAFEPFVDDGARRFIGDGVDMYNVSVTAMPEYAPANFILRGGRGDVLGGLLGQLWGGWLQVTALWVSASVRGKGYGTRLLQDAEDYARDRGAVGATLAAGSCSASLPKPRSPKFRPSRSRPFATCPGMRRSTNRWASK